MRPELFHFTCGHGRAALGEAGVLEAPVRHPLLGCRVVWLTTEAAPDREATGLGMHYTRCDRMAFRYVVTEGRCRAWLKSYERAVAPAQAVYDLERFGDPEHWWVTSRASAVLG